MHLLQGRSNTKTGCPGSLWSCSSLEILKLDWIQPWADPAEQGGWTKWAPYVPSSPKLLSVTVLLWLHGKVRKCHQIISAIRYIKQYFKIKRLLISNWRLLEQNPLGSGLSAGCLHHLSSFFQRSQRLLHQFLKWSVGCWGWSCHQVWAW